ncbi:DNA polymerase III subunit delta [Streptococcus azizii]|uniref:DNA polymerase III subunit delta n=1 Tax=Streptococcus azizii TaxID=1579424 RepID=A0AB36JJK8_9STRE|nr:MULTISPECIES: DNA polymerase III subunit delta [Streptococcus]MBF0777031.1 DNA polymerase III subunit delta [Streptococcus sp. 19428wD3_AN2]ONK25409.1 DNA polymerase III subunit delta [Streptococcus azizii]ONK25504.1 DNA polymerase III subunit delta [Streptococcus azizii]ONK25624.1 DNA polymerase III subunit delta [Streptococcus azizii]TFU81804.1 DNA polymerase III subunit delta [Streptococcus sp. AN2]
MTIIDEIQKLKKESLGLLTVLVGEDTGQFQLAKEALLKQISFDSSDLSFAYFDMSETDYAQVELDLVSLPFFADEKIVILDYFADLTTNKKRYLSDEDLKKFEDYVSQPVETTRLIVIAEGKLDQKRRLVKRLKRDGLVLEANNLKEVELRQFFKQEIQKMNLNMDNAIMDQLLLKSNFDFAEIYKNLAFLQSYKGSRQIRQDDIDQAIPKTLQDNLFDMSQLLLQGKIDQARSLVHDLRLQGEDEIKLIAILLNQFRLFLQVQLLHKAGMSEQHMVAELSEITGRKINPFQIKFALRDSRSLSLSFLKKAVKVLIETDYQIKQGQFDKDYLFDIALLKIASA